MPVVTVLVDEPKQLSAVDPSAELSLYEQSKLKELMLLVLCTTTSTKSPVRSVGSTSTGGYSMEFVDDILLNCTTAIFLC